MSNLPHAPSENIDDSERTKNSLNNEISKLNTMIHYLNDWTSDKIKKEDIFKKYENILEILLWKLNMTLLKIDVEKERNWNINKIKLEVNWVRDEAKRLYNEIEQELKKVNIPLIN